MKLKPDLVKALHLTDMVHAGLYKIGEELKQTDGRRVFNHMEIQAMTMLLREVIKELDIDGSFVKGYPPK